MERELKLSGGEMPMVAIARTSRRAGISVRRTEPGAGRRSSARAATSAGGRGRSLVVVGRTPRSRFGREHAAVIDLAGSPGRRAASLRDDGSARNAGSEFTMDSPLCPRSRQKVYTRGACATAGRFALEADLEIDQPSILGLVGPNGLRKTTLFEMRTVRWPSSGHVYSPVPH